MLIQLFKAALFYMGYVVLIAINSIACCLLFFLPLTNRQRLGTLSSRLMMNWLKLTCNIRIVVTGLQNIPDKPCVVVSNHQSSWETFYLQRLLKPASVIVKRELLWMPLFGWALALSGPIAIRRSHPIAALRQVLKQGRNCLNKGSNVIVYPEGSRSPAGTLKPYKASAAALAVAAQVPILPIAHDAGNCWPAHRFIKHAGTITVRIGEPIETHSHSPKELTSMAQVWCSSALRADALSDI